MDSFTFNESMIEYYRFKKEVKNNDITSKIKTYDCYLINKEWNDELQNIYNKYHYYKKIYKLFNSKDFPIKNPYFINDFDSLISFLKQQKEFKIVSKKLMEIIYVESYLKKFNSVKYFKKNSFNSIIEFQINNENKALLLAKILNITNLHFEKKKYIIFFNNNNKKSLYKKILSLNISSEYKQMENNNYIIPFDKFINNYNLSSFKEQNSKQKDILTIFISIFFYEKFLSENSINIFNNNNNNNNNNNLYCLINPEWWNMFKEYNNYQQLCKVFEKMTINFEYINWDNYFNHINSFGNHFLKNYNFNFKTIEFESNLNNINKFNPIIKTINNIKYFSDNMIVPFSICEMINNLIFNNGDLSNKIVKILIKDKNLFVTFNHNIEIGIINEELLFIPKYIFNFNSTERRKAECQIITSYSIKEYINYRKCDNNNEMNLQPLINQYLETIGYLLILQTQKTLKKNKSTKYFEKKEINKQSLKDRAKTLEKTGKSKKHKILLKTQIGKNNNKNNLIIINNNNKNNFNKKMFDENSLSYLSNKLNNSDNKINNYELNTASEKRQDDSETIKENIFKNIQLYTNNNINNSSEKNEENVNDSYENENNEQINNNFNNIDLKIFNNNKEKEINNYKKQIDELIRENMELKQKNSEFEKEISELNKKILEYQNIDNIRNSSNNKNEELSNKITDILEMDKKLNEEKEDLIKIEKDNIIKVNEEIRLQKEELKRNIQQNEIIKKNNEDLIIKNIIKLRMK